MITKETPIWTKIHIVNTSDMSDVIKLLESADSPFIVHNQTIIVPKETDYMFFALLTDAEYTFSVTYINQHPM